MSAQDIVTQASRAGLTIIAEVGAILLRGDAATVREWAPVIAEHKLVILALFAKPLQGCATCRHLARPGMAEGYCSGRDDLPYAYGAGHPLRQLPDDKGESCRTWEAMR